MILCAFLPILTSAQDTQEDWNTLLVAFEKKYEEKLDSAGKCECANAMKWAAVAARNGELWYFYFGYKNAGPPGEIGYIRKKYNLTGVPVGCLVTLNLQCYNFYADKILEEKYGKGFWENMRRDTDSLRERGELDRFAFYKGGEKKLKQDFVSDFQKLFPNSKISSIKVDVMLSLDSAGKVIGLTNVNSSSKHYFTHVVPVISQMNWEPAIKQNKKVASSESITGLFRVGRKHL